jgi:hypothetical protein
MPNKTRFTGNIVSDNNIFSDITNDRVGIGTTVPSAKLDVAGNVNVSGVLTATTFVGNLTGTATTATNVVGGIGSITQLQVTGISTFTNGPVFIGAATSTGTAAQPLQVTGGAYVSGNLGIGTTNPLYKFSVTGSNATVTPGLNNVLADFTANTNSYSQINTRNASNGTSASTDIIATADTGTDTTNYIDLGINNSGYSAVGWTINGPLDGYLYTSDTNLSIGAASANKYVSIFTGGTLASNERLRVNATGVGIGTTNPQSPLHVVGNALITGITTLGITTATNLTSQNLNVSGVSTFTDIRIASSSEKTTLVSGNTVSLVYNTGGGNVAICTNPTGPITLNVTGIPTDSTFDNRMLTFSVVAIQTSIGYACTAITLNGVSRTIRYPGAVVSTPSTSSYDIFNLTGINTVGSASTTANYQVLGIVNGNFK